MQKQVHRCGRMHLLILCMAWGASVASQAQPVYRCEEGGKVRYSHEPCVGAKVVDTTPTQGLDKSSGVSRKGRDVRRDEINRTLNEAMHPLTGRSHEETKVFERRLKLPALSKGECSLLDQQIPQQARAAKTAAAAGKADAELRLYESRARFRELGC